VAMNALIFVVEIVIIAIKLERGNLEYFHIFLVSICIVIGVLLAILLPIFFKILPATITIFFVEAGITVCRILIRRFEMP